MKTKFLYTVFSLYSFLFITCLFSAEGQRSINIERHHLAFTTDTVLVIQEENSEGMRAFRQWVAQKYKIPRAAIKNQVHGKIEVTFVVERDGRLSSFEILKDLGYGTGEE